MESVPLRLIRAFRLHIASAACVCLLMPAISAEAANQSSSVKVVYIIPSSHWDLGFLRPPLQEMDAIKPTLDAVIKACHADPQFRWTIESVWQLNAWLKRTKDPAEISDMAALLKSGQIELSAADGSMHTEFMGSEELNRLIYAARQAGKRFGIDPQVAMMNDVPGFSLRLPQVLARSSVKYFMTGSNINFGGGTSLWPGKMPIYWEGPDGSRVLMWQTQGKEGGYTEGLARYYLDPSARDPYSGKKFYPKSWSGLSTLQIMQRGMNKLLSTYREAGYRHSVLAVFFMHDGIGPNYELDGLLPDVRAWNASGRKPKLVVGTPAEFFADLIQHDGKDFPVYRGDWSGLWARVKVNSPGMSADALMLQNRLPQTEALWSLLKMQGKDSAYPGHALAEAYEGLFIYDEHNGAGQAGWPKVMTRKQVLEQNREYSDGLRSAARTTKSLMAEGIEKLVATTQASHRAVVVYNPLSWKTSQVVHVSGLNDSYQVQDAKTGQLVPSQQLPSGALYFLAQNVSSIGYRTYDLEPAATISDVSVVHSTMLKSPYFQVELDPHNGSIARITDLHTHQVIVNAASGGQAGALEVTPRSAGHGLASGPIKLLHERGPLLDYAVIERPGSAWPRTVISLPQDRPQIDLTETLDRSKMPFVPYKEHGLAYSFAFRFSFPGATQRWIDDGKGFYRFPQNLLPGAKTNAVVPRHVIAWSGNTAKGRYHVMLEQKQAFFDDLLKSKQPNGYIPSGANIEAMTKSDQGDTKDQGIVTSKTFEPGYGPEYKFSFAITGSAGSLDPVAAHHFGMRKQFVIVLLPAGKQPVQPAASFLSLSAPNVVVEALKPSVDGNPNDYMLRLQEIGGKKTWVKLALASPVRSIVETTLTEDRVLHPVASVDHIRLMPHETLTLRLSLGSGVSHLSGD
jgi:Glycosyl hydrolases family 38 N-terminal domain/Glycosyl hydrolases family 38 C-terminal beta sandwich domain